MRMTGRHLFLLTCGIALNACGWRDSVLTARADAGGPSIQACPAVSGAPSGLAPLPTPAQVALQRAELTAYLHFGLNTFDGTEYGDPSVDQPSLFNPTDLDAGEWVAALKDAGFQQAELVVKHTTGFCLWPSAYTDYSVANSPWKNGQGDVVRDFTDAMHAAGMRVAFYLSPHDDHYPSSSADYEMYFRNQLTELLTKYGPVYELEFVGYQAPSLDWAGIIALAHRLQPGVLVYLGPEIAGPGADLRYLGDQSGQSSRTTSSIGDVPNGGSSHVWYPALGPVSDRGLNAWFWHPNNSVIPLANLQSIYFTTVGMNTTLILNVPPATTGQLDTPDLTLLGQFGTWYRSLYATNLAKSQPISADSTWSNRGFEAAKAVDGDLCTYWVAAAGTTTARLEITPSTAVTFSVISIREPIELGERTSSYHLEIKQNGTWNKSPTDVTGTIAAGTVIGQRQLWQLPPTTADAVALVIDAARDVPAIAELGLY